jgi:hypothetical protein
LPFIAGLHEVRVQRLRPQVVVDGQARGAQRLGDNLSPVDPAPPEYRARAEVRVGLDLFEREQRGEIADRMYGDHGVRF